MCTTQRVAQRPSGEWRRELPTSRGHPGRLSSGGGACPEPMVSWSASSAPPYAQAPSGAAAQSGTPGTLPHRRRSRPAAPLAHAPRQTPNLRGWRWRTRGLVSTTHGFDKTAQSSQPRAPLNGWNEKTRRRMERDGSQRRPGQDHGPK